MTNAVRDRQRMTQDEANELLGQYDARIWAATETNDLKEFLALKSDFYELLKNPAIPRFAKNAVGQDFLPRVKDALTQMSVSRAGFKIQRTREALQEGLALIWDGKPSGDQLHQMRKAIGAAEAAMDEMTRGHLFAVGMVKHCGGEAARDKIIADLRADISELKKFMTEWPLIERATYKVGCTQRCLGYGSKLFYSDNPLADKLTQLQDIVKKAEEAVTELADGDLFRIGMVKLFGDKTAADKTIVDLRAGIVQLEGFVSELKVRVETAREKKARYEQNRANRALENLQRAKGHGAGQKGGGNKKKKG